MWRWSCLCLTLFVLGAGCGSYVSWTGAAYSAMNPPPHPFVRRTPAEVDVVIGNSLLRPHIDVGRFEVVHDGVEVVYDGIDESTADMLMTLRAHAALRGCDAVQAHDLVETWTFKGRVMRRHVVIGSCAMYTDEAAQRAAPMPAPPLPYEGQPCLTGIGPARVGDCPRPLSCRKTRCVSPYQ